MVSHAEEPLSNAKESLLHPAATEAADFKIEDIVERQQADVKKTFAIATFFLLIFWGIGYLYGSLRKGWNVIDSVYFLVTTITTVGYGDKSFNSDDNPATTFDFIFGGIYVFFGVVFIGVLAGIVLSYLEDIAEKEFHHDIVDAVENSRRFVLKDEINKVWRKCLWTFCKILLAVCGGALGMSYLEGWDLPMSFYWACVTMTTVGYGDVAIDNDAAKWFSIAFILVAFSVLASSLSFIGSIPFEIKRLRDEDKVLNQFGENIDDGELKSLMGSKELSNLRQGSPLSYNGVSRAEFVLWMLMKMDKIDMQADIAIIHHVFDKLDKNQSGYVDSGDIDNYIERRRGNSEDTGRTSITDALAYLGFSR